MNTGELEVITQSAIEVVKEVAKFIISEARMFKQSSVEYKGTNDLVSYVDKTSEEMLVKGLSKILPGCSFITEENTVKETDAVYKWIIDPLDGTTNFVHGVPCFCISVALMKNKKLVAGIIHELNLDECFYAWKGGGAFLNGASIRVSEIKELKKSLLATGFPYSNYGRMKPYMEVFDWCMRYTHGLRRLGSAAADMAYVAAGRFEGFYEYGLNAWDVAAGIVLIEEAGGKIGDFSGGDNALFGKEIISTNSAVYDEFLDVVKSKFS
ncbi:MAG TPA: inositol monophosphatase family protein [Bacteroidia bacterium]|nr:inositol monophosphatase family protein [Bacteroidia bacterium]HNU33065.1 inositol monophosphatase family protein [Bacteroidia bacterium]